MVLLKTDFSDGDVFYSGTTSDNFALNGITNEVNRKGVIHRKVYSSAAEVTHTGNTTMTDTAKTFNLTAPVNSLIIGINYVATIKNSDSTRQTRTNLKISGTNLGTYYCISNLVYLYKGSSTETISPTISTTETGLFSNYGDTYRVFSANINKPLKILDNTTTFTVKLQTTASGNTAYIKDVVIEVIYIENYEED